ncbi:phage major capsid protein [Sphingobacterium sp. UBA6645]|uniref:phage major capsid protein n=1 Tax=Sphingobacterium sp. UBA6645 TaxID=1947511 RepID=UPI0025F19C80|nr:phage major capsid protein [Sphingobacterium sp. UBA6645]
MELEALVQEVKSGLEGFKTSANQTIADQKTAIEALTAKMTEIEKLGGVSVELEALQKDFNTFVADFNEKGNQGEKKNKSFGDSFADAIKGQASEFATLAKSSNVKLDKTIELKDVDFDSFSAGALTTLTEQVLPGINAKSFQPMWLRNIFPSISSTSGSIKYLQENETANATDGAADIWDGSTPIATLLAKPDVGYNFNEATAELYWIAGIVRIKRELLDDVSFLRSYIPQQLVYGKRGILVRENTLILSTLNTNSTAYDGAKTVLVEKLYDAAFGQLRDNYYNPTHILMNNREVVDLILNKATGSGEYDLPPGTVSYSAGKLTIGGIEVIGLPQFAAGTAFVIDANQSMFVNRMSPEVRFFEEDRDNVIKNLVTIRGEERAGFINFDPKANIKVTIAVTP